MVNKPQYSTVLTGAGFMMYEFKQLVSLKLQGFSDEEIKHKVLDENIFQHNRITSIQRALPYLLNRVNALDETLHKVVVEDDIDIAKTINLYGIMKTDRLFNEFMHEVVLDKLLYPHNELEDRDLNSFFTSKAEQSDFIQNLADSTTRRLRNQFLKILIEADIVVDRRSRKMQRLFVEDYIKQHIISLGDHSYLQAIGENEGL